MSADDSSCALPENPHSQCPWHFKTHGASKTRLYKTWISMRKRCNNTNDQAYALYGGRGIKVCSEWDSDFVEFRTWALANGYRADLTIERKDSNGGYEPGNCTWIPQSDQPKNTRAVKRIEAFGECKTIAEWSHDARCVVNAWTIGDRLAKGWSSEAAISTRLRQRVAAPKLKAPRKKRKTVADHAADILRETNKSAVTWGDCGLLDMIAVRGGVEGLPTIRRQLVMNRLEGSPLFGKTLFRVESGVLGMQVRRVFTLKQV